MSLAWRPNQRDLGCAVGHTVYIMDRGGARRIDQLYSLAQVQWSRARDAVSDATIRIAIDDCTAQRESLGKIEPKRTEIAIFRGVERVWEGVVWRTTDNPAYFEIYAKDVFIYTMHTPLSRVWSNRHPNVTEMTTRIENMMRYELTTPHTVPNPEGGPALLVKSWEELDPPANIEPHIVVHHWPNEARTSDYTDPYEMTLGQYIQDRARTGGIDYTTIGRAIHIWDTSRSLGQTREMTEDDFDGPIIVTMYGSDHTTFAYVTAEDGQYGVAGVPDEYYGPWATIYPVYNEDASAAPTVAELRSQAQRNIVGRTPVPVEVRVPDNSTIRLSESLTINDLIPGTRIPLAAKANVRNINQPQKLQSMRCTEDGSGETVQVTLTPATRVDSDVED